jgi:hypothetical protein
MPMSQTRRIDCFAQTIKILSRTAGDSEEHEVTYNT